MVRAIPETGPYAPGESGKPLALTRAIVTATLIWQLKAGLSVRDCVLHDDGHQFWLVVRQDDRYLEREVFPGRVAAIARAGEMRALLIAAGWQDQTQAT